MVGPTSDEDFHAFRLPPLPGRHPLILLLCELMAEERVGDAWLCDRAGIVRGSVTRWRRRGHSPNIATLDTALQVLGYELAIRKKKRGDG